MKEVFDFLIKCGVYYLATCDGDQPRVRPFGTQLIFDDKLYIMTDHRKNIALQLEKNARVELCAFDTQSEWVRIEATLVEDPSVEPKKAMLDSMPHLRSIYDETSPNTAAYYLKEAKATFYSYTGEPRVVCF